MDFGEIGIASLIGASVAGVAVLLMQLAFKIRPVDEKKKKTYLQFAAIPAIALTLGAPGLPRRVKEHFSEAGAKPNARVIARAMKELAEDPAFKQVLAGTPDEARSRAQQLTARGTVRLPVAEMRSLAELRGKLAEASPAACVGMWSGAHDPKVMAEAIEHLSTVDAERFAALITRAARLELAHEGEPPAPPDASATIEQAVAALGPEGAELSRVLTLDAQASDPERCAAVKLMIASVARLPDAPARDMFLLMSQ